MAGGSNRFSARHLRRRDDVYRERTQPLATLPWIQGTTITAPLGAALFVVCNCRKSLDSGQHLNGLFWQVHNGHPRITDMSWQDRPWPPLEEPLLTHGQCSDRRTGEFGR